METPADLGSSFFQICLGLKSEGLDRLLNHIDSYEENKQRLEPHSHVGFSYAGIRNLPTCLHARHCARTSRVPSPS